MSDDIFKVDSPFEKKKEELISDDFQPQEREEFVEHFHTPTEVLDPPRTPPTSQQDFIRSPIPMSKRTNRKAIAAIVLISLIAGAIAFMYYYEKINVLSYLQQQIQQLINSATKQQPSLPKQDKGDTVTPPPAPKTSFPDPEPNIAHGRILNQSA